MTESNVDREALQGGGPSQLLEAFVSYLRVPSTRGDEVPLDSKACHCKAVS